MPLGQGDGATDWDKLLALGEGHGEATAGAVTADGAGLPVAATSGDVTMAIVARPLTNKAYLRAPRR